MNDFHSGVSATVRAVSHTRKVLGSIPGVDKGILKFWGAYRPAFSENEFKTNFLFFWKIKFLDMNRYEQICTDMHRYAQICTAMHRYTNIWTDTGLMHTDINRYSRYAKILTYWHIFTRYERYLTIFTQFHRYKHMNRYKHMDRYGHKLTIFTDTNIWTDIDILTDTDRYERYSHIQSDTEQGYPGISHFRIPILGYPNTSFVDCVIPGYPGHVGLSRDIPGIIPA